MTTTIGRYWDSDVVSSQRRLFAVQYHSKTKMMHALPATVERRQIVLRPNQQRLVQASIPQGVDKIGIGRSSQVFFPGQFHTRHLFTIFGGRPKYPTCVGDAGACLCGFRSSVVWRLDGRTHV